MARSAFPSVVRSLALILPLVSSTPVMPPSIQTRQDQFPCMDVDPKAVFDGSCWQQLDLSNWLNNWSPPTCGSSSTATDCCRSTESWANCFLRLGKGASGYDCDKIKSGFCTYDPDLDPGLSPDIKPQVRYIMKTIFCEWSHPWWRT